MNRRQLLIALAAGAVVTAEGLWIPGKKLISIPKRIVTANYPNGFHRGIHKLFKAVYGEDGRVRGIIQINAPGFDKINTP